MITIKLNQMEKMFKINQILAFIIWEDQWNDIERSGNENAYFNMKSSSRSMV